jgi:hypothetical protein
MSKRTYRNRLHLASVIFFTGTIALAQSCSKQAYLSTASSGAQAPASHPNAVGAPVALSDIADGSSKAVSVSVASAPAGTESPKIIVQRVRNKLLYAVEAVFTEDRFNSLRASSNDAVKTETDSVLKKLASIGAIPLRSDPALGYFKVLLPYESKLFAGVDGLRLQGLTFEPVIMDLDSMKRDRSLTPQSLGIDLATQSTADFSGLGPIGAVEFEAQAEKDIGGGVRINGSSVQIGITDTGITYNHPTFKSALNPSKVRISYINDSTGEGTIYINPSASFSAKLPDGVQNSERVDQVVINAQIIQTPVLPTRPEGDNFITVTNLQATVSPELKQILLDPTSGAKLGVLFEQDLQGGEVPVDLANDGDLNEQFYLIYVPAGKSGPERVYFDKHGKSADFSDSVALEDFNQKDGSHPTMDIFAEKLGFTFTSTQLTSQDGMTPVNVRAIAFVGFDEGDHGTHVSGIAAGSKTIQNDPAGAKTLARGVAPEAMLAVNRVCSNNAGCGGSEGIVDLIENAHVDVINMSLGGLSLFNDGLSVQETLINRATSISNVLFSISAGNSGPGKQTLGSPSTARLSLSIGASASNALLGRQYQRLGNGGSSDFMLFFSSRGPTASGGFKPSITAPGTELSSLPLNTAPGGRGGLDVYWGTSMAAPTVTGGYALFLDAIRKYNIAHPATPLTTDVMVLRRILLESARPFDVNRVDSKTGEKSTGQYTWLDEGAGMLDLPAAWKMLFAYRESNPPSSVSLRGKDVELDYDLLIKEVAPNGNHYDGSTVENQQPAFGEGLYLSANDHETLKHVAIIRQLPDSLAASPDAADLMRSLLTTSDEFVLKTVYYGRGDSWLKVGVRDQLDCLSSDTANLLLIGSGAAVQVAPDGLGLINPTAASLLNICVDRLMVSQLSAGDHGALIYAYRTIDHGKTNSPVASFIVPVSLSMPNQVLGGSSAFDHRADVKGFGLDRNYVSVPLGTSLLRVTLSVPQIKTNANGDIAPGSQCSGVELMGYAGQNTSELFKSSAKARVSNCTPGGAPILDRSQLSLVFTENNPHPGLWDLHVFGQVRYPDSQFELRVDYVNGATSVSSITGDLSALKGDLTWIQNGASIAASPSSSESVMELTGYQATTASQVAESGQDLPSSPLGQMRQYPVTVGSVTITTGGSPNNDIDLLVIGCPQGVKDVTDPSCKPVGLSDGPTDQESVTFIPQLGTSYVAMVLGSTVRDPVAKYVTTETLTMLAPEVGKVTVSGSSPHYAIGYSFPVSSSSILQDALFTSGNYDAVGDLSIRLDDGTVLSAVPVDVKTQVKADPSMVQ